VSKEAWSNSPAALARALEDLRRRGSDHAHVEVKRARGGLPQDLWETVSAFANARGGLIILGVDERSGFTVTGVEDPATVERQLGELMQQMEPPLRTEIDTVHLDGKAVVLATVPPAPRDRRPCHRRSVGPYLGSRIRVADGNRRLTEYEVGLLVSHQREPRDDVTSVPEADLRDLDGQLVQAYVERLRRTRPAVFGHQSDEDVLRLTNVVVADDDRLVPTLAGVLSFATYPQHFFPQLFVSVVRYPTPAAGAPGPGGERFLDSATIDGPIFLMVEETVAFLKRNMKRRSIVQGLFRHEEWEYPEIALREAIVNALVHRDLSVSARGTQVQIELYPDRLLVRSPGGLYGPVSVEELGLTGTSSSRNRSLLKMLADVPADGRRTVCENVGTGIFVIRRALTDAGMEPPEFRDNVATFEVIFPNHTLLDQETLTWMSSLPTEGLVSPQMVALALARRGQTLTNQGLRAATGVADSREAGRLLKDLVDRGLLLMEGSRGQATYHLPERVRDFPLAEDEQIVAGMAGGPDTAVLAAIRGGAGTRREIETVTGLPTTVVSYQLNRLRGAGLIEMVGKSGSKTTTWRALD
jgi:ATP-dependent DNA helicase RecG